MATTLIKQMKIIDPLTNPTTWYSRYVAQGGKWGNAVTEQMALIAPPGLLRIHTNMPGTVPPTIAKALLVGEQPPGLSSTRPFPGALGGYP